MIRNTDELYAVYCGCGKEIASDVKICQDCENKQINREEELAEDDRLFGR